MHYRSRTRVQPETARRQKPAPEELGEETAELVTACADTDAVSAADVVYHLTVALRALGVGLEEVQRVL